MFPTSFDPDLLAYLTPEELAELDLLIVSDPTVWRPLPGPQSMAYYSDADIIGCTADMWEIILPAIVTPENLPYFRERLERRQVDTLSAYLRRHPLEPR